MVPDYRNRDLTTHGRSPDFGGTGGTGSGVTLIKRIKKGGHVVELANREPLNTVQLRSPRNRRGSIVLLRGGNLSGDDFDKLPNFLERSTLPEALNPAASETFGNAGGPN